MTTRDLTLGRFGGRRNMRLFVERLIREIDAMDAKATAHCERPHIVGTCYEGTILDVQFHLQNARNSLREAAHQLR